MSKLRIGTILFLVLIFSLTLTSCNSAGGYQTQSSNPINIPSSNYPVDLIGQVTIANNIIENGKENSPQSSSVYWIIQVSIRNKSSQSPITLNSSWMFVNKSNPSIYGVLIMDLPQPSPVSITQGETGELTLCCTARDVANPNQYQICLESSSPMSYGNLVNTSTTVGIYNWDLQKVTEQSSTAKQPKIAIPSGTFTTTQMGVKITVTFKSNNTLEANNPLSGKTVYKYSISSDGQSITETNIATNQTGTESFEYIPAQGLVVLGGVSYFK